MSLPLVAIIGRPNVGKSTLFNRILGVSRAVVEEAEGVTRDRNYAEAEWEGKRFIVVDTGGFYPESAEEIFSEVREQAMFAAEEADLVIHLMNARDGLTPADLSIAAMLRESGKRIIWAANKIDGPTREDLLFDFYRLGSEDILPVSAATGYMLDELMEKLTGLIPEAVAEEKAELPKIAVLGRPNVGKSTMVNALLGKKRLVVSPVAGTTRDAIDTVCTYYGRKYLLIDTAGIKRKAKSYPLERFSMVRTLRSIERCDAALILLDAPEGITSDDQKIAGLVHSHGKSAVFVFNKWDLVAEPDSAYKKLEGEFRRKFWFFDHAPFITTSGLERKRITKVFPILDDVLSERGKTIPAGRLSGFLEETLRIAQPPLYKGKRLIIAGFRQIGKAPPAFALYVSEPAGIKDSYIRFLEKRLRERYGFRGTPIRIVPKRKR